MHVYLFSIKLTLDIDKLRLHLVRTTKGTMITVYSWSD